MLPRTASSHPRRPPAHLSVSLRHDEPPPTQTTHEVEHKKEHPGLSSLGQQATTTSSDSSSAAQKWFNKANNTTAIGVENNDPPYFLKRSNSSASDAAPEAEDNAQEFFNDPQPRSKFIHPAETNGSSADDYRSVIDDLTIQNQKLKERLKKYEAASHPQLDQEKLFEVKVHGLSSSQRRRLEETLRSFASSVTAPTVPSVNARCPSRSKQSHASLDRSSAANASSSSTSNSRLVDSAYASASMNSSEAKSGNSKNHVNLGRKRGEHPAKTQRQKVQSFLHDIPEGLLPKHHSDMSEKAKKKIVVRRLEQLFTGKRGPLVGPSSQPLQQQEISTSAARADQAANELVGREASAEGVREAHIVTNGPGFDRPIESRLKPFNNSGSVTPDPNDVAPEQRPTRPLDLDPERAQNATDNIQYIRHLGLDFPKMMVSTDAADSEGWVYLNLLVSMAQLHMINVTPDFIRSAVSEVSEKFEVSNDGRKLRWRGGSEGTKLSSDSGGESTRRSPNDSDSFDDIPGKPRHTIGRGENHMQKSQHARGQFEPYHNAMASHSPYDLSNKNRACYYKPLFRHKTSSGEQSITGESDGTMSFDPIEASGDGALANTNPVTYRSGSNRNEDDPGMLVFYTGASFCIDLSAERGSIPTPSHNRGVGKDGYSNHTNDALGCAPISANRNRLVRTESGSFLPFRPFKDYSKGGELLQLSNHRPSTPARILSDDESDGDVVLHSEWSKPETGSSVQLPEMKVTGLGGTRPADRFEVSVETKHMKLDHKSQARLSKFSAPSAKRRKFMHTVSRSSLDSFYGPGRSADSMTARLAARRADSPPLAHIDVLKPSQQELTVKTQILSSTTRHLEPFPLPAPAMWYHNESTLDSYSDSCTDSSGQEIQRLRKRTPWMHPAQPHLISSAEKDSGGDIDMVETTKALDTRSSSSSADEDMDLGDDDDDDNDDDDDDDESIDMLAAARKFDPVAVAAQEAEFDKESSKRLEQELPFGSSAATADGTTGDCGSGFNSPESSFASRCSSSSGSGDEYDDDDDEQ